MATSNKGTTLFSRPCKEKLKSFAEEWKNNFKMCYCPCRMNANDSDSDEGNPDNETTFLLHNRGSEEVIKEESKVPPTVSESPTVSETALPTESESPTVSETVPIVSETVPPTASESVSSTVSVPSTQDTIRPLTVQIPGPPTDKQPPIKPPTLDQLQALNIEPMLFNTLGYYLEVGQERLNEIGRDSASVSDSLTEMYRVWLEKEANVSWEQMSQALEDVHLIETAREVRSKYIQRNT